MSIRGHRHSAESLRMRIEGSGGTLTEALEDAMDAAVLAIPEAREVKVSYYTFEVESKSFTTFSNPTPERRVSHVVAEVDLHVELREKVRERRDANG